MTLRNLPSREKLWRSVYKADQLKPDGSLKAGFFKDKRGLSSDLARLSTIEKSRRGYQVPPTWPEEAGLVELTVGVVRKVGADVNHTPLCPPQVPYTNYAHAQIDRGLNTAEADRIIKAIGAKPFVVAPRVTKK